jgi:hypothetical protein
MDPATQAYIKSIMEAAQKAGAAGPSPLVGGATDYNSGMMKTGNLGMGALSGDPAAVKSLMDPYQQQVIDANNAQWQRTNQNTMNAVNDRATAAGAFGGNRRFLAQGTALSGNNIAQQQQTAGLLSSGFGDAMQRALAMSGMGAQGSAANANLGMGGVGSPQQWLMQQLKSGFMGPLSTTTTGSGAKAGTDINTQYDYGKALIGLFG